MNLNYEMKSTDKSLLFGGILACLHASNQPTELPVIYDWFKNNVKLSLQDLLPSEGARKRGHYYGERIKDAVRRVLTEMVKAGLVTRTKDEEETSRYEAISLLTRNRFDGKK
jgi:hypothetical protein